MLANGRWDLITRLKGWLRLHRKYIFSETNISSNIYFFINLNLNISLQKDKQTTILAKVIGEVTRV